jgi:hypothetical protein
MSEEEVEEKKRKVAANKKIVQTNLSFEDLKTCIEDGADPNTGMGAPLKNMVKEDNLEAVRYLLERNANPNMKPDYGSSPSISMLAKSLDMLKLLVEFGGNLDEDLLINDEFYSLKLVGSNSSKLDKSSSYEIVEYLMKQGIDPNTDRGVAFRLAAKYGRTDLMDLLCKYFTNIKKPGDKKTKLLEMISSRDELALKVASEYGEIESIKFIFNKYKELGVESFVKPEVFDQEKEDLIAYVTKSKARRLSPSKYENTIKFIQNYNITNESNRFKSFNNFKY